MDEISGKAASDQETQNFVANAVHEIKTPLSIILGYLENLREPATLDDKDLTQSVLDVMDRHVVRINRIVDEMLIISKLETRRKNSLDRGLFNIASCARDVIERLEIVIKKQQVDFDIQIPELEISGDQFYWSQILFNLIENSLKQNPDTAIKIRISAELNSDESFTIRVYDNGIGIPPPDLPFIFKPFYRVKKHHPKNHIKGTGLGLSIVKQAVEAHGGTITVRSIPNVETLFVIVVPHFKGPIEEIAPSA
jgi:two-component system phosphate regulon sensor histidine kinase PhoR